MSTRARIFAAFTLAVMMLVSMVSLLPSPEAAAANTEFTAVGPKRIADTRASQGAFPRGTLRSSDTMRLNVGTTAPVALNLTAVAATNPGFLSMFPCADGYQNTSSVNFPAGAAVANMAVIQPDSKGLVCVYAYLANNVGTVEVVIDQTGEFASGGALISSTPTRLYDSRDGGGAKVRGGNQIVLSGLTPNAGHILNLTVTQPDGGGHLTAYPCAAGRPTASSSNYATSQTKATMNVVKADSAGKVCVWTLTATHIVVDRFGQFAGGNVEFITPVRIMDTRPGAGHLGSYYKGRTFKVAFPSANQRAVALNVTVTQTEGPGFVTAYPCGQTIPNASMLNYAAGQTVPNGIIIQPSQAGEVCFWSYARTELIVDLAGYIGGIAESHPPVVETSTATTTTTTVKPTTTTTTVKPTTTTTTVKPTTTTTTTTTPTVPGVVVTDWTDTYVAWINPQRAELGLPPVIACDLLRETSAMHALDNFNENDMNHTIAGESPSVVAYRLGYGEWAGSLNDNIGAGTSMTFEKMVAWWKSSPMHWGPMIRAERVQVGMAEAKIPGNSGMQYALHMGPVQGICNP